MNDIVQHLRLMLIGNLASAASRIGGLDETEAWNWAEAQSDVLLASKHLCFDKLEELALNKSAADLHWLRKRLKL